MVLNLKEIYYGIKFKRDVNHKCSTPHVKVTHFKFLLSKIG